MLFYGRLLATNAIGDVWQEENSLWIHLRERNLTIAVTREELSQLIELLARAQETARIPERRHDKIRRLQVSRARIADRLERAKARDRVDARAEEEPDRPL
jgi:hypothetical protein